MGRKMMMACGACLTGLAAMQVAPVRAASGVHVVIDAAPDGMDHALEAQMEDGIAEELGLGDTSSFLNSMADAAVMSTKGMGVDYASNFEKIVLGWSVGSSVDEAGQASFGRGGREMPEYGFAFQMSGMIGLNLGLLSGGEGFLSRVAIFGNGMAMQTGGETFRGHLSNFGAHLQLRLVKPTEGEGMQWGGLAFTSGYEWAEYRLDMVQGMPIAAPGSGADLTWNAEGEYFVKASSGSIPLELSTNLKILIVTGYLGGGVDIATGDASNAMELTGPIKAEAGGQSVEIGTATVSLIDRGAATSPKPRIFGGLQLNILMIKLYGQLNVGVDSGFGGHVGLRMAL